MRIFPSHGLEGRTPGLSLSPSVSGGGEWLGFHPSGWRGPQGGSSPREEGPEVSLPFREEIYSLREDMERKGYSRGKGQSPSPPPPFPGPLRTGSQCQEEIVAGDGDLGKRVPSDGIDSPVT